MSLAALAVVAAFTAAGLSLVSVIISVVLTARLTGRNKRDGWRRQHVLPVVSAFLSHLDTINETLGIAIGYLFPLNEEALQKSREVSPDIHKQLDDLQSDVIVLELIASVPASTIGRSIVRTLVQDATSIWKAQAQFSEGFPAQNPVPK